MPDRNQRLASSARLGIRRLVGWGVDWLFIAAYAALLVPVGLLVARYGEVSPAIGNLISFVLLVVPVTWWLALQEKGRRAATPGKRLLGLRVDTADGQTLGARRALVRNALKVALPWELGHTAAFTFASPTPAATTEVVGMVCGILGTVIALSFVVSLFVGSGRTPYDRIAGTYVAGRDSPQATLTADS